ncbi:calcium-dependent cysteine-type endopeptidase [Aureococcus anophagefferens]|nr:calcium-dependent cysteine-type endopeptidase [Aureococcus anophagefferens]
MVGSKPELLSQILVSSALWKKGIYTVKFFKAGKWRYVHVDDKIPCDRGGRPHFARSCDANEAWVMVVEKAFAKLHSCYEAICAGGLEEGLKDCTGAPTSLFDIASPELKPKTEDGSLWTEMLDMMARGSVVGICDNRKAREPLDPIGMDNAPSGLLKSHVYVVEKLVSCEAEATAEYDALETKMVMLTNPARLGAWNGNWCPDGALWRQYPPIAAACGMGNNGEDFKAQHPSSFWMEWADVVTQFDTLLLTQEYSKEGGKMTYRGSWIPGDAKSGAGGGPAESTWGSNPQYVFDVTEPGSYALVPATLAAGAVATSFVVELHADALINFQNADDDMPDLDVEDDDPDNVSPGDADAAANYAALPPAPLLPEPEGRELQALWSQAANLAAYLKSITAQNAELEAKILQLEEATSD